MTITRREKKQVPPALHGLRQWGPYGHLAAQHKARAHPAINKVFQDAFGCERRDLVTSNDALCMGYPTESKKGWLHVDMPWTHDGVWCIQVMRFSHSLARSLAQ